MAAVRGDAAEFDPADYERYQAAAEETLRIRLIELMTAGTPVVLDFSFWSKRTRDRYKDLIVAHGCHWQLIYLKTAHKTLRHRLASRNKLHGADAVTVSDELLDRYLAGFEEPVGEGEITIAQDGASPRRRR